MLLVNLKNNQVVRRRRRRIEQFPEHKFDILSMGNKLGRKRQVVDERYTRPQGLDLDIDVDIKKLRKLILESKLAPCYPGDEECCSDLEECPICFLYYPSLNRSRCCMKKCFLQMKNPNSARPSQCPFCKTPKYAVEYRGAKTKEEKGIERIEEQRVIEAQLRMRQRELQDEEERMQKALRSSNGVAPEEVQDSSVAAPSSGVEEVDYSQDSQAALMMKQPANRKANRDDCDFDLEDIMVTEAIWQSIQHLAAARKPTLVSSNKDDSRLRNSNRREAASSVQYVSSDCYISPATTTVAGSSSSASGGLVCAVDAFAEGQQMTGESSLVYNVNVPAFDMLPSNSSSCNLDRVAEYYLPARSPVDMSANDGMAPARRDEGEWGIYHESEVAGAGISYLSSDVTEYAGAISTIPQQAETRGGFCNVPESYEEQMMLAMNISMAEGRAMTRGIEFSWH